MNAKSESRSRSSIATVDGVLLLNKPAGMSSNRALQKVKRLLRATKGGHTGSLDPAATGMLPLCFGEATKICAFLLEADKTYRVVARLGVATDTGDADGDRTNIAPVPNLSPAEWEKLLAGFEGEIMQIPPMYSALKKDGKRLYELARKGQVVDREARPVTIREINLLEIRNARLAFRVRCSKGTYVRTLVEDIAKAAGTLAHTANLYREAVGAFKAEDMLDLTAAELVAANGPSPLRERLLPADAALASWNACHVSGAEADRFCGGQSVPCDALESGLIKVYDENDCFLGIGSSDGAGTVAPKRIFHRGSASA